MARDPYLEHLANVPLFAACTKKHLKLIAQTGTPLDVPAGKQLVKQGTPGREFFVILSGDATVSKDGERLATLHQGDFFGEMALIEHIPRVATVEAQTAMQVMVIDRSSFWALLEEVPEVAGKVLIGLSRRFQELSPESIS